MVTTYHMTVSHEYRPVNLVLRKVLRNACYTMLKPEAGQRPERERGLRMIRRMLASMIAKTKGETVPADRKCADLAAWENEGGASGVKSELPIDIEGCRPCAEAHD